MDTLVVYQAIVTRVDILAKFLAVEGCASSAMMPATVLAPTLPETRHDR